MPLFPMVSGRRCDGDVYGEGRRVRHTVRIQHTGPGQRQAQNRQYRLV